MNGKAMVKFWTHAPWNQYYACPEWSCYIILHLMALSDLIIEAEAIIAAIILHFSSFHIYSCSKK